MKLKKNLIFQGHVVKKYLNKAEIKYNLTEKIFLNKSLQNFQPI